MSCCKDTKLIFDYFFSLWAKVTPAQEMEVMVDMEYVSADRSELVPQYRAFPKRTSIQPAAGSPIGNKGPSTVS